MEKNDFLQYQQYFNLKNRKGHLILNFYMSILTILHILCQLSDNIFEMQIWILKTFFFLSNSCFIFVVKNVHLNGVIYISGETS